MQTSESSPVRDRRSTTEPPNQLVCASVVHTAVDFVRHVCLDVDCHVNVSAAVFDVVRCNEMGHFARDCPNSSGGAGGGGGGGGGSRGGGRGMSDMRCYNCNEVGHISRNCPTVA